MIIRGGVGALDGRDFREWGAIVQPALSGEMGGFSRTYDTRAIDGRDGEAILQAAPVLRARTIDVPLAIEQPTHALLVAAVEDLQHYCERGPRRLTFSHTPGSYWRVRLVRSTLAPGRPRMTSRLAFGTLSFVSVAATRFALEHFRVAIVDNTERVPIPLGTGDVALVFRSAGGNQQQIIQRDHRGVIVATQTLAVDLSAAPNDCLIVDNGEENVFRSTAGVLTPADSVLQGSYLTLSPRHGDRESNAWGTLEVTSGRLEVAGRWTDKA